MPKQTIQVWYDLVGEDYKPRAIDGRELPGWQSGPVMAEYVRLLRRDGWRLAAQRSASILFERDLPSESMWGSWRQFLTLRRWSST